MASVTAAIMSLAMLPSPSQGLSASAQPPGHHKSIYERQ